MSSGGNKINANNILAGFGDTVATAVFMNGFDKATDTVLFVKNFSLIDHTLSSAPSIAQSRFYEYLDAKSNFYGGAHNLFQNTTGLTISQIFQQNSDYNGGQHRGIDISGPNGTNFVAGYSGKVVNNYTSATAGNSIILEYGFSFEDTFYSTGIQAQFIHLVNRSQFENQYLISANSILGKMGNTGWVDPAPTPQNPQAGTHLHYQLMGNLSGYGATNIAWNMLNDRRNTFLGQIGTPSVSSYVMNQGSSSYNNYTGSVGSPQENYYNYFYNPNKWAERMFN